MILDFSVEWFRDVIPTAPLVQWIVDPDWSCEDSMGHHHDGTTFFKGTHPDWHDPVYPDEDDPEYFYEEVFYRCNLCKEQVIPEYKPVSKPQHVLGQWLCTLTLETDFGIQVWTADGKIFRPININRIRNATLENFPSEQEMIDMGLVLTSKSISVGI